LSVKLNTFFFISSQTGQGGMTARDTDKPAVKNIVGDVSKS